MLEGARREFAARGYEAATLAAIAAAAGVSLATVKLVEPTKARLLVAAIRDIVRSDDASLPLVEQPSWTALLAEPSPERLLVKLASRAAEALERQADLLSVVWQAAPHEPEIATLEEHASLGRWDDMRTVAVELEARGCLRPGLTVDGATDTLWVGTSPQSYSMLVRRRGWTRDGWAEWLGDLLVRALLREDRGAS